MLRYYCLPLPSPSPVPQSWRRTSEPRRHVGAEPPQGRGAGAERRQCGEGGPNGPAWKNPLLPCSPGGTGWRLGYPSNWEAPPGLSPAGAAEGGRTWPGSRAGWADGHVRRWPGNHLHPLQCPHTQEQDFFTFVPPSTGHSLLLCQKIGKSRPK